MKIKNKRMVTLSIILGILLFIWWLLIPVKYDVDDFEKLASHWDEYEMANQGYRVRYSLSNIGTPVAVKRFVYSKDNLFVYHGSWLNVLLTIGHYDEAIDYLNNLDYNSRDLRTTLINNICYNNQNGVYPNKFKIMTCAAKNNLDLLLNEKKYIAENKEILSELKISVDSDRNYMEDIVNGVGKKGKAIIHKPLPICETNRDRGKVKLFPHYEEDVKFQFCGAMPSVIYYLQHGQINEANKYLNTYKSEYENNIYISKNLNFMVGLAYYQNNEFQKAIPLFEKVLEIQDYNYKAHEKLSECYNKIGNMQKVKYHENIMKELLAL